MLQRSAIKKKLVQCSVCKRTTGLYRVELDEYKRKKYICSLHPKKELVVKREGIQDKDDKFFNFVWKEKEHFCAECGKELKEFNRYWIHHILAKSKYKYFRYDIRNTVMLCYKHHNEIESATSAPKLKIYNKCEKIKEKLLSEVGIDYKNLVPAFEYIAH